MSSEYNESLEPCPKELRQVEVAVVGNGPASILLSLLLSGYWPYFTGSHPNLYLSSQLAENQDKSILEQDLELLSEGLEGRSNNPVALLFDTLFRPNTDIDGSIPSSLRWKYDPSKAVPHVVVGRGNPGGFWQYMHSETKTLSQSRWLELPLYSFSDWRADQMRESDDGHMTVNGSASGRALSSEVAAYYSDYVTKMGLGENFITNTEISQVDSLEKCLEPSQSLRCRFINSSPSSSSSSSLSSSSSPSPTGNSSHTFDDCTRQPIAWDRVTDICSQLSDPEDCGIVCEGMRRISKHKWYLRGIQAPPTSNGSCTGDTERKICVFSQKLVLACGVYGIPRHLGVPGEDEAVFLTHRFADFADRIQSSSHSHHQRPGTVLVVGAGLTAADAVILAMESGANVVHVFKQDPYDQKLIFSRMPERVYSEYKYVYKLMQGLDTAPNYTPCARSHIGHFETSGFTTVAATTAAGVVVGGEACESTGSRWSDVQLGGVFIGSRTDLSFLPEKLVSQLTNGSSSSDTDTPAVARTKSNPVIVDPVYSVMEASPSLYAVGSLAGDSFVRFGVGTTLGAAQHCMDLHKTVT